MKTLLAEIHRRSLWQVVVIYLLVSAAVYWAVGALTESVGLPVWTPAMAFLILLIALPFTVAAALVREAGDDRIALSGLIAELHRRSLWQVMGIFLAGSWGALQVVEVMTETAGLPDWTPTMALVLLLIGLPVCLATAFVQEGLPVGADDDEAVAASAPGGAAGLFTWRNAFLGAVGALALLGLSAGSYLLMWSMGLGPVGNLVAQGMITEGQQVVLADFTDGTGEGYAAPITEALRIDLLETAVFEIVSDVDIRPALELMQLDPAVALTPERARDVATRLGVSAVLEGDLTSLGTGYILTATLREAGSWRSLAGFRVTAEGPNELIQATDQLSQDIREKSGESLRTIRTGKPLEQVTTTSMEALRLYTDALVAFNELADPERARLLLDQALARDSTFAMAWRMRGLGGGDPERRFQAIANAYRFREKVPDLERYIIEGLYFSMVGLDGAIGAYENALLIDPSEVRALNNGAGEYLAREDVVRARELLVRAVEGPNPPGAALLSLLALDLFRGRPADARSTLQDWEETLPGNAWARRYPAAISFAEGNLTDAARQARARLDDPDETLFERAWSGRLLGRVLAWSGQLDEARATRLQSDALGRRSDPSVGWQSRVETAYDEALLGDVEWAGPYVLDALSDEFSVVHASAREHLRSAMTLVTVGDLDAAEGVLLDWQGATREEWQGPTFRTQVERVRLQIQVARGESVQVSQAIARLLETDRCSDACWLFERAVLHDRSGNHEQATALYERVVAEGPRTGSVAYSNIVEQLHAMLRLGPLYEELGDTARAVEAYQRIVDQWAGADARGMETVRAFRERIAELGR